MENAIYMPTPKTLTVNVYTTVDADGNDSIQASTTPAHLLHDSVGVVRQEVARVVGRGNLAPSGNYRWYQVELADGSRHMVVGEGS